MLVLAPFTLLVAAVAALQSPHRKAASLKQSARTIRKREVTSTQTEPQYLNKKTESESGQSVNGCNINRRD
jgi:carboxypeptidase D